MTQNELVAIVTIVCQLKAKVPEDKKLNCMDHFVNCMVVDDGKIEQKNLTTCLAKWEKKNDR